MNTKIRFYMRGLGIGILVTALILIAVNLKNNKGEMTDAEIRERAAALGMVDANSYSLTDAASAMNSEKEDAAETGEPQTDELKTDELKEVNPEEGTASEEEAGSETEAEETKSEEEVKSEELASEESKTEEESKPEETKTEEPASEETKPEETKPEETKPEEAKVEEPKPEETAAEETKPAEGSKVTISIARGAASETAAATLAGAGLIEDAADFNSYMIRNGYDRRIHPGTFEILMGSSYEEICKIIAG